MKNRVRQMLNFFAFNCLFFALYLNFIKKDNEAPETFTSKNASVYATSIVKKAEAENKKIISASAETVAPKAP